MHDDIRSLFCICLISCRYIYFTRKIFRLVREISKRFTGDGTETATGGHFDVKFNVAVRAASSWVFLFDNAVNFLVRTTDFKVVPLLAFMASFTVCWVLHYSTYINRWHFRVLKCFVRTSWLLIL